MSKQYPSLELLLADLQPGDIVYHVEPDSDLSGLNPADIALLRPDPDNPDAPEIIGFNRPGLLNCKN